MASLFDPPAYQDILRRVDSLKPNSPRQWGKMSVSQMLEHTSRGVEMATGKRHVAGPGITVVFGALDEQDFRGSAGDVAQDHGHRGAAAGGGVGDRCRRMLQKAIANGGERQHRLMIATAGAELPHA